MCIGFLETRIVGQKVGIYIRLLLRHREEFLIGRESSIPDCLMPYKIIPITRHVIMHFQGAYHVEPHFILEAKLKIALEPYFMVKI